MNNQWHKWNKNIEFVIYNQRPNNSIIFIILLFLLLSTIKIYHQK